MGDIPERLHQVRTQLQEIYDGIQHIKGQTKLYPIITSSSRLSSGGYESSEPIKGIKVLRESVKTDIEAIDKVR